MDMTSQGLSTLLLSIACRVVPCSDAFSYAGWLGEDDEAPGVRRSGDRYVELPKRARPSVLRHLDHACTSWSAPRSAYELRKSCECCLAELVLDEPAQSWFALPLQCSDVRFGVLAVALDARNSIARSDLMSCAEKLAPVFDALFELYSCCQRLQRTLPDAMAAALHEGLRHSFATRDTAAAPPDHDRRPCEPVVLGAAGVAPQVELPRTPLPGDLAISPVRLACGDLPASRPGLVPGLSKREQEIGALLVAGYAAVNAAAVLGLSEHTVRTYVRRLYRKLAVSNRAELVRLYMEYVARTDSPAELTPGAECLERVS
jgi:DNA-binding CsgD family transcriptional regulator